MTMAHHRAAEHAERDDGSRAEVGLRSEQEARRRDDEDDHLHDERARISQAHPELREQLCSHEHDCNLDEFGRLQRNGTEPEPTLGTQCRQAHDRCQQQQRHSNAPNDPDGGTLPETVGHDLPQHEHGDDADNREPQLVDEVARGADIFRHSGNG